MIKEDGIEAKAFEQWLEEDIADTERYRQWRILWDRGAEHLIRSEEILDRRSLDDAIDCFRKAVSITSRGVGDAECTFVGLGNALLNRFWQVGDRADLDQAILYYQGSLDRTSASHPNYSVHLSNLANALCTRFQQIGDRADLDKAIAHHQGSLDRNPAGHPDRAISLSNLANTLWMRFQQIGDREDLDQAISYYQGSLDLRPAGHPLRSVSLNNLANAFKDRFKHMGDRADLDQAVSYYEGSLGLTPVGHPNRSMSLNNLASALLTCFEQIGDRADLDKAIAHLQSSLDLRPAGHPDRSMSLSNLANALLTRFKLMGDRTDLDQAISYHQGSLDLTPAGHPDRSMSLNNLANDLFARFEQIGDRADLDQAISYYQASLDLRPAGHPDRSMSLNNLANVLFTRFWQTGDRADLEQAISHHQGSLVLRPAGHPLRSVSLNNLANALKARFEQIGDRADLNQAISYYQGSLDLRPAGHPLRFMSLNNLANALFTRFWQIRNHADLDQAISHHQGSLDLMSAGHPNRSSTLRNLAQALRTSSQQAVASDKLILHPSYVRNSSTSTSIALNREREILDLLREATSVTCGGPPDQRLRAALDWIANAIACSDSSTLEAYRVALELLETVVATGRSMESRHMRITSTQHRGTHSLAVDAAALAITSGDTETAVELLEQGRSVLLAQAGQYRTRIDELRIIDAKLAHEFTSVARLMEGSVMSTGVRATGSSDNSSAIGFTDAVGRYVQLSERWTAIVDRIRSLEGFESFLRPTPFASLCDAAKAGPVILVNISERRSDAIVLLSDKIPLVVPLPSASPERLAQMVAQANEKTSRNDFDFLLKEIWESIVQPVVALLQNDLKVPKGSRIWWCPTGAACRLPLHAAGTYTRRDLILPNIYISSYTSTLSSLIRAREGIPTITTATPKLLVVGQANTPEHSPLPSVHLELKRITSIFPGAIPITGEECTREVVLQMLPQYPWTHIACHGHVNQDQPFRSHFSLQDGPITLLDIAAQNLPNAELAFLAACHSAEGNIDRPDEVLHLAAGLQFSGVRSVVGTLWGMCDEDGPNIAYAFYSKLLGDMAKGVGSSAHALHWAVGELRKQRPTITSSRWACFVHYGR